MCIVLKVDVDCKLQDIYTTRVKIMWRGTKLVLGSLQLILETIYGGGCHLPAKYVRTAESHGTRQQ